VKGRIRNLMETTAPTVFPWINAYRTRRLMRNLFGPRQLLVRERLFGPHGEPTVLSGPFRGMRYFYATIWGSITPRWLGSYEFELWNVIENSLATQYSRIINAGSAEGYYAVGYAWRNPSSEVFAFDIDPVSRTQTRQLAKMNGVSDRVRIEGCCSHDTLNRLLAGHTLLIMDVEGYEAVLLDPLKVPGLAATDILVELHDVGCQDQPRVEEVVHSRFASTHQITSYSGADRSAWMETHRDIWEGKLFRDELMQSVDESRTEPQRWLWMVTKGKS
jgi:hypothetical protein